MAAGSPTSAITAARATAPKPVNPLTGQAEFNGTSIVDVTDPSAPKYLHHIPGKEGLDEAGGAQMVRVCSGKGLSKANPNKFYLLRVFGNSAHEVWDVTDPGDPKRLSQLAGLKGTHKNFWECDTGIAYLVSGLPAWRTRRMTQIYDLSDPTRPVFIRNFGLPGPATGCDQARFRKSCTVRYPPGPAGNRVYFGYGTNKNGVMQIVDREKASHRSVRADQRESAYPQVGQARTVTEDRRAHDVPHPRCHGPRVRQGSRCETRLRVDRQRIPGQRMCRGAPDGVDRRRQRRSQATSRVQFHRTRVERRFLYARRTLRHAFVERKHDVDLLPACRIPRAFQRRRSRGRHPQPFRPAEIGYYIPATTDKTVPRCVKVDGNDQCKIAIQTNNVEVDDRGYIYIVDRANTGLHILKLTGEARKVANFPQ